MESDWGYYARTTHCWKKHMHSPKGDNAYINDIEATWCPRQSEQITIHLFYKQEVPLYPLINKTNPICI